MTNLVIYLVKNNITFQLKERKNHDYLYDGLDIGNLSIIYNHDQHRWETWNATTEDEGFYQTLDELIEREFA